MSSTTIPTTTSSRKRGPPAPLTLASNPIKAIALAGPADEKDPSPANDAPAMPQLHATTMPATRESRPTGPSRNVKRLSLSISSTSSSQNASPQSPIVAEPVPQVRRHSLATLPNASVSSILRRTDEGDATNSAYLDGPIEVMPGVWLGAEENARDWKGLLQRGIRAILNVAKEVSSPFDSTTQQQQQHPVRNVTSTPNLTSGPRHTTGTYQPAHPPSGRPGVHYLKMPWSHGQADLVRSGFAEAMQFIDEALARHEGVLIHCQCGVSRSATMVIAFVMRAAALGGAGVPAEVVALRGKGMQGAYDYVQQKSKTIGPNMSLIYQLLDYERALKAGDSPGKSSFGASDDEEWERQRRQLDSPDQESNEILKEAKELDREMEERRARKLSLASTSSNTSTSSLVVNSAPWRVRYGARSRAASMDSNFTSKSSVSVLSEDPLEEEDEDEEQDPTKVTTPDTDATDDDAHCFGMHDRQYAPTPTAEFKPSLVLSPPSAPPSKVSFGIPFCPPSATPHQVSFPSSISGSSVTSRRSNPPRITLTTTIVPSPPSAQELTVKREKRRPPPLKDVTPVVPFPSIQIIPEPRQEAPRPTVASSVSSTTSTSSTTSRSRRLSARLSSLVPFPVKNALAAALSSPNPFSSSSSSMATPTPSATQTLFVFPPSPRARGVSTPSVLTLTSTPGLSATFTGIQTPLASGFRRRTDSRKSWIGLSAVTPTTATARVDARGQFEKEPAVIL